MQQLDTCKPVPEYWKSSFLLTALNILYNAFDVNKGANYFKLIRTGTDKLLLVNRASSTLRICSVQTAYHTETVTPQGENELYCMYTVTEDIAVVIVFQVTQLFTHTKNGVEIC